MEDFTVPSIIPEDLQAAYRDEARRTIAASTAAPASTATTPPPARPAPAAAPLVPLAERVSSWQHTEVADRGDQPQLPDPASERQRALVTAAMTMATLGVIGLTIMWTVLALTGESTLWFPFAALGWVASVTLPAVGVTWWQRRQQDTG